MNVPRPPAPTTTASPSHFWAIVITLLVSLALMPVLGVSLMLGGAWWDVNHPDKAEIEARARQQQEYVSGPASDGYATVQARDASGSSSIINRSTILSPHDAGYVFQQALLVEGTPVCNATWEPVFAQLYQTSHDDPATVDATVARARAQGCGATTPAPASTTTTAP